MAAGEPVDYEACVTAVSMDTPCASIAPIRPDFFMGLLTASQAADGVSALACLCALHAPVTSSVAYRKITVLSQSCLFNAFYKGTSARVLTEGAFVLHPLPGEVAEDEEDSSARPLVVIPPPP